MRAVYVIFLATLAGSQVQAEDVLDRLQEVRDYVNGISSDIKYLSATLGEEWKRLATEGSSDMEQQVNAAIETLKSKPIECTIGVHEHLLDLKKRSVGSFLHCSNLTDALVEAGSIVFKTLKLAADLAESVNDVIQLTVGCNTWNPWTLFKCWKDKIEIAIEDVHNDVKELEQFKGQVTTLAAKIRANIAYCWNPQKFQTQLAISGVLGQVNTCAQRIS